MGVKNDYENKGCSETNLINADGVETGEYHCKLSGEYRDRISVTE